MLTPTVILCRFIPGLTTSDLPVCLAAVEESASRLHEIQDYAYADDYDDDYYIGTFVDGGNDSESEPSISLRVGVSLTAFIVNSILRLQVPSRLCMRTWARRRDFLRRNPTHANHKQ
jgi:hypothetical protein